MKANSSEVHDLFRLILRPTLKFDFPPQIGVPDDKRSKPLAAFLLLYCTAFTIVYLYVVNPVFHEVSQPPPRTVPNAIASKRNL